MSEESSGQHIISHFAHQRWSETDLKRWIMNLDGQCQELVDAANTLHFIGGQLITALLLSSNQSIIADVRRSVQEHYPQAVGVFDSLLQESHDLLEKFKKGGSSS